MTEQKTKDIAEMTAEELFKHITDLDAAHRESQKHLKALLRCRPGGAKLLEKKASK